jgi:hypothetical protein
MHCFSGSIDAPDALFHPLNETAAAADISLPETANDCE